MKHDLGTKSIWNCGDDAYGSHLAETRSGRPGTAGHTREPVSACGGDGYEPVRNQSHSWSVPSNGARRCRYCRQLHRFRSSISILRRGISILRSPVSILRSPVSNFRSTVSILRSPVSIFRSFISIAGGQHTVNRVIYSRSHFSLLSHDPHAFPSIITTPLVVVVELVRTPVLCGESDRQSSELGAVGSKSEAGLQGRESGFLQPVANCGSSSRPAVVGDGTSEHARKARTERRPPEINERESSQAQDLELGRSGSAFAGPRSCATFGVSNPWAVRTDEQSREAHPRSSGNRLKTADLSSESIWNCGDVVTAADRKTEACQDTVGAERPAVSLSACAGSTYEEPHGARPPRQIALKCTGRSPMVLGIGDLRSSISVFRSTVSINGLLNAVAQGHSGGATSSLSLDRPTSAGSIDCFEQQTRERRRSEAEAALATGLLDSAKVRVSAEISASGMFSAQTSLYDMRAFVEATGSRSERSSSFVQVR